jgi:drug/metabolite transporter (DMT)-like permease
MYYILILQQIIASTTHIIAKNVLLSVPSPLLLVLRASIASLGYIVYLMFKKEKLFRIERKDILGLVILAILNIPINQFLFFISLKYTSPPNVALAYALTPAFILVIAFFFLNEKLSRLKTLGIAIALGGTLLILFEKGVNISSDNFVGNLLALSASLAWAVYTIVGKKYVIKYGAIYTTAVAMLFGLIAFLPIFFIVRPDYSIFQIDVSLWGQIFYLGLITSGVAYVLWYFALKKMEASKLAVFSNLQPILTTVMAIIFLDYTLTGYFIIGGILTIIGVIVTQRG